MSLQFHKLVRPVAVAGSCLCAVLGSRSLIAAEFHPLGFLSGGSQSIAYDVSPEGIVTVGESLSSEGMRAFRWTVSGDLAGPGAFPGASFPSSQARGVSGGGAVIVGCSTRSDSLLEEGAPFYWTGQSGMVLIPSLSGSDTGGIAEGVTPDGSVIVGWCASPSGYQAFRWSQEGGTQGLDLLKDEQISRALSVSADGSVIVGNVSLGSTSFPRPFRWTAETGKVVLPELSSETVGTANAVTPDGTVIVGLSAGRAVRWQDDQVVSLGEFPGGSGATVYWANAVTADGGTVVGLGEYNASQGTGEAFIWDEAHGIRRLRQVLVSEYGLNLNGWTLFQAMGISADGSVIVGYGFDPEGFQEAWMVRLRYTPGDLNCDGAVNVFDIDPFVLALTDPVAYAAAYPNCSATSGDINGDGVVNTFDIDPFVLLLTGG